MRSVVIPNRAHCVSLSCVPKFVAWLSMNDAGVGEALTLELRILAMSMRIDARCDRSAVISSPSAWRSHLPIASHIALSRARHTRDPEDVHRHIGGIPPSSRRSQ